MARSARLLVIAETMLLIMAATLAVNGAKHQSRTNQNSIEADSVNNTVAKIDEGRQTFRFDMCADEAVWGHTLRLHEAIESTAHGGVSTVSPHAAIAVGLKVNIDARRPHETTT